MIIKLSIIFQFSDVHILLFASSIRQEHMSAYVDVIPSIITEHAHHTPYICTYTNCKQTDGRKKRREGDGERREGGWE